jgi:acetyl-CoA synthetase
MRSYQDAYTNFSIVEREPQILQGSLSTGLNACVECCDRWANSSRVSLEWLGTEGKRETVTYATLQENAARFANLLNAEGVAPGDVVAGLLPRIPELLTVILGTWRAGAVYQPLFTAFGPKALEDRLTGPNGSNAKLIVTDAANRPKLDHVADCPASLVIDRTASGAGSFGSSLARQSEAFEPVMRDSTNPFIPIFTSGTTGKAKGVPVPLAAILHFGCWMHDAIGLTDQDAFWCMADPGWALGMYVTILGTLLLGCRVTLYEGAISVESTVRVIADLGVTNLVASPTVFRMMRAAGEDAVVPIKGQLRAISGGGEPLGNEMFQWIEPVLGCTYHDGYGQTESGLNIINHRGLNHPAKAGSVGLPCPGFSVAVLDDDLRPLPTGQPGILAIDRSRSPLFYFNRARRRNSWTIGISQGT